MAEGDAGSGAVSLPATGGGPASYTIAATEPLLFVSAAWTQDIQASGVTVVPAVLIFDQSGELVARAEGPSVFVP